MSLSSLSVCPYVRVRALREGGSCAVMLKPILCRDVHQRDVTALRLPEAGIARKNPSYSYCHDFRFRGTGLKGGHDD